MRRALGLVVLVLAFACAADARVTDDPDVIVGAYHWLAPGDAGVVQVSPSGSGYAGVVVRPSKTCKYRTGQRIWTIGPYDDPADSYSGSGLMPVTVDINASGQAICVLKAVPVVWQVSGRTIIVRYTNSAGERVPIPLVPAPGACPNIRQPDAKDCYYDVTFKVAAVRGDDPEDAAIADARLAGAGRIKGLGGPARCGSGLATGAFALRINRAIGKDTKLSLGIRPSGGEARCGRKDGRFKRVGARAAVALYVRVVTSTDPECPKESLGSLVFGKTPGGDEASLSLCHNSFAWDAKHKSSTAVDLRLVPVKR